ncbi:hypothetical protein BJV82DRAFT_328440 [Fennellomyces sp. T-0311]|nr:hypothetical protein BJV82DRAFT_328440 [Fennellomyces sp. T-0311]
MSIVRKTETNAKTLMYNYLKEECQQQWSPYTNGLFDKINVDGQRLDDDLSDKRRRGMQSLDEIKKKAEKDLMDGDKAQRIIKAKFENAETVISRHWIEKKYRRVVEERDKQMGDARGLCAYVATRNSKDVARRIDGLKKDVLDGLCNDILQSYISKRAQGYGPTLQHIATYTQTHRTETLQSIVSEWHQRLTPIQLIADVYFDMEATKARLDAVASQSDKDTIDRIQTEVVVVEKQVTQALRKAKRLRQDQIMLSNARKKARLCSIERKAEQLENMIGQAKHTVLSESFPMQTERAVTEVYEVLNNHGEFIRRLVDPVAAKNGEEINKSHLDTISTLHDGLTFPLRFSIEKMAQSAVQDVFSKAMERLDILEKRIV